MSSFLDIQATVGYAEKSTDERFPYVLTIAILSVGGQDERESEGNRIIEWVASLSPQDVEGDLIYTSIVNSEPRGYPLWLALAHFFNHQTHHRGQVTTLLAQLGAEGQ